MSLVGATVSAAQFTWSLAVSGVRALVQFGRQLVVGTVQAAVFGARMIWAGVTALASFAANGWRVALGVVPQIAAALATATLKAAAFGARMLWVGVTAIASFAAQAGAAVAAAIPGLIAGLAGCATAAWSFAAALLANPITWVVAAVVAGVALVGYGVYQLVKHWDDVKAAAGRVWDTVSGFGSYVITSAKTWGSSILSGIGDALSNTGVNVGVLWDRFTVFGANLATGAVGWGKQLLDGLWQGVGRLPEMLWDSLKQIPGLGTVLGWGEAGVKAVAQAGKAVVGAVGQAVSTPSQSAQSAAPTVTAYPNGLALSGTLAKGITAGKSLVNSAMAGLTSAIDAFLPHSPAKQGPLSTLDETGPRLVDTLAKGIVGRKGVVAAAMSSLLAFTMPTLPALAAPELPAIQPLQVGASIVPPALPRLQPLTFPAELEQSQQATFDAVAGVFGESDNARMTRTPGGGRSSMAPVVLQVPVTIQNINVPPGATGSAQEIGSSVADMVQREVRRAIQKLLTETWISAVEADPEE